MPLMDENYLIELCANPNTVENSPSGISVSGSKGTENICGGHTTAGCLTMGSSIQPSRGTATESKAQKDPPKRDDSYPSSLRSTSTSCSSYSLEISGSTTNTSDKESRPLPLRTPPESRNGQNQDAKHPSHLVSQKPVSSVTTSCTTSTSDTEPLQNKEHLAELKFSQCLDNHGSSEIVTEPKSPSKDFEIEKTFLSSSSGDGKVGAQPVSSGHLSNAASTQEVKRTDGFSTETPAEQEGEDTFYAFVILHAPEDAEEAVRLKSRFESISSTIGATFSDFEIPGQSTFRCVEDAIENSAFVMLLLTPNFNTHLNETNADSALMNSIDKPHKYNTVIPLLPRANGLTRDKMPYALKTKNPLDETKGKNIFENMAQKVLNSRNIERQKLMWRQEQLIKKQQKKRQMLQEQARYNKDLIREASRVRELEEEVQRLKLQQQHLLPPHANQSNSYQGFSGRPQFLSHIRSPSQMPPYYSGNMWQPPPSNIHIQNAKCIMIGNNSTMTVGEMVDSGDEDNL